MNKIKFIALSALVGLATVSCKDVLDDNVNPDKAHAIDAKVGLPTLVFYAQQVNYDNAEYNAYFSQMLTTTSKTKLSSGYSYKSEWELLTMNRHPQWRRHFYDICKNGQNLIANSKAINSPNYELIARTIQLMSTQLTTDEFGDMPRSQALQSNSPQYDSQASIYAWMFQEAEDLIKMYEDPAIVNSPDNQKIGFDIDRSAATCQKIVDAADAAIRQWRKGDLLYGSWFGNEPRYNFSGGTGEQSCVWSVAQPKINSWESRANLLSEAVPSKFFMVDLLGLGKPDDEKLCGQFVAESQHDGYANDPRCGLLMIARTGPTSSSIEAAKVKMRYLEANIGMGSSFKAVNYPDMYMGAYAGATTGYNPLFTMEELYFIKAEALYWLGEKSQACELAKEATQYNIQRHLDFFLTKYPNPNYNATTDNKYPGDASSSGVPGFQAKQWWDLQVDAFLNNTEDYTEKVIRGQVVRTYNVHKVTERGNKHWFFNPSEFSLSDLMQQKFIALYLQAEQWTDMRRYHYSNNRNKYGIGDNQEIIYPTLRRPYNLYAAYWIDGLTEAQKENTWIQRINYDPETEEKYNRAELERLGAYKNYKWLQEPMIWAKDYGVVTSLTGE